MIKVHSYESMGTHDGPGLRLVVFLQGCNFKCLYCANPDTITLDGGNETPPEEILKKAVSQKAFFGTRGGVTFSGGEPTVQAKELIPLIKQLKAEGIGVCIDTNGGVFNEHTKELFKLVDLVLLDIKEFDENQHKKITSTTIHNTLKTADWLEENNIPMWMRYVLVPSLSDSEKDLRALGQHFSSYKSIQRFEILPYHTLGKHKYKHLDMKYELEDVEQNTPEQLLKAQSILQEYFHTVYIN